MLEFFAILISVDCCSLVLDQLKASLMNNSFNNNSIIPLIISNSIITYFGQFLKGSIVGFKILEYVEKVVHRNRSLRQIAKVASNLSLAIQLLQTTDVKYSSIIRPYFSCCRGVRSAVQVHRPLDE